MEIRNAFGEFATRANAFASSPAATAFAFILVVIWAAFGPASHYSETWQLLINTGTTIVTFLMVFILNNAQSRDTKAINAKLDSLIFAVENADNRLMGMEHLPESKAEEIIEQVESVVEQSDAHASNRAKQPPVK